MEKHEVNAIEFAKLKKDLIEIIEKAELGDNITLLYEEKKFCPSCEEEHKMLVVLSHASDKFLHEGAGCLSRKVIMRAFGIDDDNHWGNHKEN
jgi:hypothetical protein